MYDPSTVEPKWQKKWEAAKAYKTDLQHAKNPYYSMVMFPYPSGDKLHVGHWYNYAPADSYARFKKMQGYDVFTPMGFDAFGLPAENYAIKTGVKPAESTAKNVKTMIKQLKRIGCMYDWDKTLCTTDPEYYRWTQWLFLQMYKHKLAYKKLGNVNFCPSCQTVLANEQCQDGKCERCSTDVIQKPLDQWYWNIKKYSQKLLDGLENIDWPERTKTMQRNWIGRSEGCDVRWKIDGSDLFFDTFTTTVDTIYGVTFVVISPEHPSLLDIVSAEQKSTVEAYVDESKKKTDLMRMSAKEKTGVFTGAHLIHPCTGEKVPLWVADYVLMSYGTGVVMGVPAHDRRDLDFAEKYKLPIVQSVEDSEGNAFVYDDVDKYAVIGTLIDSGPFTGMSILDARKKIVEDLGKKRLSSPRILYRLRDWLVSRQRYWGAPIPIVYDPEGNAHPVPDEHLPWMLPTDVEFKPSGKSPLTDSKEFIARTEKIFGKGWRPEFDTMDTFVCSSFYYLRYLMEGDPTTFVDPAIEKKWMPVDMYIGGPEHACMHLIYARFVTMALKDFGSVSVDEPFKRLVHQGLITNSGAKMSKSKGNVVSPDAFVERYGSDVFRMYLMFMGPFEGGGDWSDTGIKGIDRFVQKVWKVFGETKLKKETSDTKEVTAKLHLTIKKVTEDIERLHFNTCISGLMELLNLLEKQDGVSSFAAETFAKLLSPLAPHLAEELWQQFKKKGFIVDQKWPAYDPAFCTADTVTIAVQVNGKLRGTIVVDADTTESEIIALAKEEPNVAKYLESGKIKKEIYVPSKLVSFVM